MKTKNLLLLVVVALLLLGGWYLLGSSVGSVTSLKGTNFAKFTAQFDSASGDERLLVLVSPT